MNPIVDLHCDTVLHLMMGKTLREEDTHISLAKLRDGGVMAQCFAIFTPFEHPDKHPKIPGTALEFMHLAYDKFRASVDSSDGLLVQARSVREIRDNYAAGKINALLTVENSVALDGDVSRLDTWHDMGVKMAGLTWNYENSLGYPNHAERERHILGLKPFGKDFVRRCDELGIAVDVSHLNEGGFWDVIELSKKPVIASHSCARALCDVQRNLTDEQLRAIAKSGGVVGVNYYSDFIHTGDVKHTTAEEVVRHLRHMADVAGVQVLALGSDYDGIDSTVSWGDAGGQQALVQAMEGSFKSAEIDMICHENALRAFRDIWGE